VADGPDRARRSSPAPGTDDVLARLGLTGATPIPGGRADRRRAAEEAERRRADQGAEPAQEQGSDPAARPMPPGHPAPPGGPGGARSRRAGQAGAPRTR
jgi:hypothetical protein